MFWQTAGFSPSVCLHPSVLRTALSLCCTTTVGCVSQRHCGPLLLSFVTGWLQSHCGGANFNETAGQAKPDKSQISLSLSLRTLSFSLPASALPPGTHRNLLVRMRTSSCSRFFPLIPLSLLSGLVFCLIFLFHSLYLSLTLALISPSSLIMKRRSDSGFFSVPLSVIPGGEPFEDSDSF